MDISEKQYPYPVLKPDGDDYAPESRFDVDVKFERDADKVTLRFYPSLHDDGLRRLICVEHLAQIICHVESPQTVFRTTFNVKPPACDDADESECTVVEIPATSISGRVSVCPFVVAVDRVTAYSNNSFNPDYDRESFNIDCAAVLAEGTQSVFNANTATHELEPASSIFVVSLSKNPDVKSMRVDCCDDKKIRIVLPETTMQLFKAVHNSGRQREMLWAMLYAPALIRVFDTLQFSARNDTLDEYKSRTWYASLDSALRRQVGFGIEDPAFADDSRDTVELAELVVKNAIEAALASMNSVVTVEAEEGN